MTPPARVRLAALQESLEFRKCLTMLAKATYLEARTVVHAARRSATKRRRATLSRFLVQQRES